MYENYKIVCNTAAGRRVYMQYLIPQVISSKLVDRYDLWINTTNMLDIEFFKCLEKTYPKINLVWQPDGIINGNASINAFYKNCVEDNTIYIKLDDDIIWIDPTFFEKIIKFRIENPQYFLITPLVINNPKSTYILQVCKKLNLRRYLDANSMGNVIWRSGDFAYDLHRWFFSNYLIKENYKELYCGIKPIGITRFSINSIVWFGFEMKKFDGIVLGDDEEFLSSIKPTELGMSNCYYCNAILVHFSFFTQREKLNSTSILESYGEYLHKKWKDDDRLHKLDMQIHEVMKMIDDNKSIILRKKCPYKIHKKHRWKSVNHFFQNLLPAFLLSYYQNHRKKYRNLLVTNR